MNERERVLTALSHVQPDFTPFQLDFTQGLWEKVSDVLGVGYKHPSALGNHLALVEWGSFESVAPHVVRDQFGVVWDRTIDRDIGVVSSYPLKDADLSKYQFPDPAECPIPQDLAEFVAQNQERFRVVGIGFSLFERAWTLRGMENLLMDMYLHPAFVDELIERITEYNLALIERALQYDIDCVLFGDDWGQQTGLIFGKKLWQRFFQPALTRMFARVKADGKFVMLHSCGKIQELFPDLIDMGLDIFNTFQPEVMDPNEMKKQYGDRLTFYGGISTQRVLPFAAPSQIIDTVKDMISVAGKQGGYIVAPTHDMPVDIPVENVLAFIEAVRKQ